MLNDPLTSRAICGETRKGRFHLFYVGGQALQ
jgi:hypothetical protein